MPKTKADFNLNLEEMARAGLHFGHRTSKLHPQMEPYIYGVKSTVHLIDLEKTKEKFEQALAFLQTSAQEGKKILLVGTKPQCQELVKATAEELGLPYVVGRWLGGSLTNFSVMEKRIERFNELEEKKKSRDFEKYTKKERAEMEKELQGLQRKFGGVKELKDLPGVVFVCSLRDDCLAVKEAKMKGIWVIGVADTNTDPTVADYVIPANDDAVSSVKYILEKVKEAIAKAKPEGKKENVLPGNA